MNEKIKIFQNKGDFFRAIDDYSKALDLDTDFSEAFNEITDLLVNCSDGRCRTNRRGGGALESEANVAPEYARC